MSYVVKGTPPGYDVFTAVDYLQSFNSGWPLLKVHDTENFSGTVTHSLGYPPFFFMASTFTPGAVDEFAEEYGVDSSVLARTSGAGTPRYYIFRLDLTTNFTAETISGSTTKNTPNDGYVFKVTKPGKSTTSTDMRDFALHSNTRSPMVHQVNHGNMSNTGGGLGFERTVTHNLGYVPTAFAFMKPGPNTLSLNANRYFLMPPPVGVTGYYYTVSSTQVYVTADPFYFSGTPQISVVILKDPFNKETVNVSFP